MMWGLAPKPPRYPPELLTMVKPKRSSTQQMHDEYFHWPDVKAQRAAEGRPVDRLFQRAWEFYHEGNYEVAADLFDAAAELKEIHLAEIREKGT